MENGREETKPRRTDEQRAADDAALLASGEPLAILPELAAMLAVPGNAIRSAMQQKGAPLVRYLSTARPVQFCVADVRDLVERARGDIEARRARAEESERTQRHQAELRRTATLARPSFAPVSKVPASATRSKKGAPEVVVVRKRSS